ncbi:MAG: efflux RND transporter permease subunit [Brevinematia bacterium]
MDKIFSFIVKKPVVVLLGVLAFFLIFLSGIFRMYIDNDLLHWFSRKSKIGALNYYINERFESNNPILIMLEMDDGVLNISNLTHIRNISREGKEVKGVVNVISFTEVEDVKSTAGEMIVDKLLPENLGDIKDFEELKKYILSKEGYNGSVISRDGKSTVIIFQPSPEDRADVVAKNIRRFVDEYIKKNSLGWKVYYGGTPMLLNSITDLVVRDLRFLVPLVSIVVFLILFISFRNIKDTILPLLTVLMATACAMGVMGFFGRPLTTFGVAIPVVLIAVGNAYGIHVINEYHEKKKNNHIDTALTDVLKRTFIPILMSALTTFGGFLSIAMANEMLSARDFGLISSVGVIFSLIFTLSFIPPILKFFPGKKISFGKLTEESEHGIFMWWAKFVYGHKKLIVFLFGIVAIISAYFLTRVKIKVDYLSYFHKKSEPAIVTEKINKTFDGSFELKLYTSGNVLDSVYLRTLQIIEEELRFLAGGKTRPTSLVPIISSLNEGMTEIPMIPDTSYEVENLYFFIDGNENVKRLMTDDKKEALVSFLLPSMESSTRYELVRDAEKLLKVYKNVSLVDSTNAEKDIKRLVSKMVMNRIIRAEIKTITFEKVNELIDKIPLKSDFKNYEEKFAYLLDITGKFYKNFEITESQISKSDLLYALSPLVWDKYIYPNGDIPVFEKTGLAGLMKLFTDVENTLLKNQLISLGIIVLIVVILNTITFKSLLEGALSLLPILFTLLVNFGVMGLFKINMDFITITIASIAVGAGIDYTIHFLSRFTHEIKNGKDSEGAFYKTFVTTGKGILFNSLSVGFGFAVLNFSSIMPLRSFGILMFLTMLVSAFASLTLLPAFIIYFRKLLVRSKG